MTANILFVDDDKMVLKSLGRLFAGNEYELYFAENAKDALGILENEPMDLVVADQNMPGMTGSKLLEIVGHRWPDAAKIVLSGSGDPANGIESEDSENKVFHINKPWDTRKLKDAVFFALNSRGASANREMELGDRTSREV